MKSRELKKVVFVDFQTDEALPELCPYSDDICVNSYSNHYVESEKYLRSKYSCYKKKQGKVR